MIDWKIPCLPINLHSFPNHGIERMKMNLSPTIQTFSGKYINFDDYTQNVYDINDIAHALSHICRFTGHCKSFYSVAQHCVLASYVVPEEFAFEALMHDRIEAYMGDMSSPLKQLMLDFLKIEKLLEHDSALYFGLPMDLSSVVKDADYTMLVTEKRDLMAETPDTVWAAFKHYTPLEETIYPWSSNTSKNMFIARFNELIGPHCERVGIKNAWETRN